MGNYSKMNRSEYWIYLTKTLGDKGYKTFINVIYPDNIINKIGKKKNLRQRFGKNFKCYFFLTTSWKVVLLKCD